MKFMVPGVDLDEEDTLQVHEVEAITFEDYDRIIEEGWGKFFKEDLAYRITSYKPGEIPGRIKALEEFAEQVCTPNWDKRNVRPLYSGWALHPFFALSIGRSFLKFTEDLYYRPEVVHKVMQVMTEEAIQGLIDSVESSGQKSVIIGEERVSAFYYPLEIFERLWWPYTVQIIDAMWSRGVVT
ncbi:MAG: hypothetical protein JRC92_09870, partial [Deltaproteobacteria bacterium]|nr:hypothetical protein [Deltaproteobacteria bacterium]